MKYFKYRWEDTRGDEFDGWGFSNWFVEVDEEMFPVRQIESYDNGNILKYDTQHLSDEFGFLADQAVEEPRDDDEIKVSEITQKEFEGIWNSTTAFNK